MKGKKAYQTNSHISKLLRDVAAVYLITNENRFKVIAYERAADTIEHLDREIKEVWQEGKLDQVPGLGESLRSHLDELFKKGHSTHFDKVLGKVPAPIFELMRIPSIGPKTAFKLADTFRLTNSETVFDDIYELAKSDKISKLEGFGPKSQSELMAALVMYKKSSVQKGADRMPLPYADTLAKDLIAYLNKIEGIKRIDALGSLRRRVTTIGDIDIAVQADKKLSKNIIDHFINYPKKLSVDNRGEAKSSIIIFPGIRVDLRVQEPRTYGSMLQYFTGGKSHNIHLREYAQKHGLSLNEYGIKNVKTGKVAQFSTEGAFYNYLKMALPAPEIREGTTEITLALQNSLPKLVEVKDIKGDFHTHSSYDLAPSHDFGNHSYKELVEKAKKLKYDYIGFSDHNPKLQDHSEQDIIKVLKKRKEYIEKNVKGTLHYFMGLEVDILPNGKLAVPQGGYEHLDYMLVSIHSAFRLGVKEQTARVLKALAEPKVKILGHPTGRLLQKREGYELEWKIIFEECKKRDIAIEINSWPQRLDLPDTLVREAKAIGVKFCINTDSHDVSHMDNMEYGVSVARRGWCEKHDIINTLDYEKIKKWIFS